MPKVSVIIPVYNAEKFLRECMVSILGQTLKDIEIFCINDGSTDGTAGILGEFAAMDARVRLLGTDHVGAYKARREGLRLATGTFIHFMDSDDVLSLTAYEELVALAEREELDQIVFSADIFTEGDSNELSRHARRFEKNYDIKQSLCNVAMTGAELFRGLASAGCYTPGPPMRIIRRTVLEKDNYVFPEAPFHGDNYFTTVGLYNSSRALATNRKYYKRRVRADSITTSVGTQRTHFISTLNVVSALCEFPPFAADAFSGHPAAQWYLARLHRSLMKWADLLSPEEIGELCRKADGNGALPAFFCAASRPLAQALRSRPNSVRGCVRYILRWMFGRRG